jgi:putative membrane protein
MKRLAFNILATFVLLAGYGCDQSQKNTEKKQPAEEVLAETAAESGYGEDAAGAGQQVDTAAFAVKAASAGMMEVALGQLTQQKAINAEVKKFGQTMVDDHGKANKELQSLAAENKIALPTAPLPKHQQHIDHLNNLSGVAFDSAYMSMMVMDHQHDIAEFEKATQNNQENPQVKAFAQKTLPVLKQHLDMAQKTNAKVK